MAKAHRLSSRNHDRGILIPAQHRILSTLRRAILHISPALQKLLVQHHPRQFARDGAVDIFDDGEVCWEENVEVALLNLSGACISRVSGP